MKFHQFCSTLTKMNSKRISNVFSFFAGQNGCKGGNPEKAFQWAQDEAVCTEQSYLYDSTWSVGDPIRETCKSSCEEAIPSGGVFGVKNVESNEKALMEAVAKGPVSVGIEADQSAFQLYKSGVLKSKHCGTKLDHGVLTIFLTVLVIWPNFEFLNQIRQKMLSKCCIENASRLLAFFIFVEVKK